MADTWAWNSSGWSQVARSGPLGRFLSAMAFDGDRHRLILFGGRGLLDQYDDTWSWDGKAWTQLHPAHHPGALSGQLMVYDEFRRQLVLFGGFHGVYTSEAITDTWTWDGQDWTLRASVGPKVLNEQAMAFDSSVGKVILFGGSRLGVDNYSDQTWAWDGKAWTQLMPALRPTPRSGVALAWDSARKALLLFGGAAEKKSTTPDEIGVPLGDTWTFSGSTWTPLAPVLAPTARADATMAYDTRGRRLILFGGNACPFRTETWAWDGATWKLLRQSPSPAPRTQAAMAADPAGQALVLFGGLADTPCL